jgi:hypothetical protein
MRTFGGIFFALILATGLYAQNRASVTPVATGSFGSVVFPGGTPATTPGVTRSFGNLVNPGGGGPRLVVPGAVVPSFARPANGRPRRTAPVTTYAYPVYMGGAASDNSYAPDQAGAQQFNQQSGQQPNVTIVMPPQQVTPLIINVGPGGGQYTTAAPRLPGTYDAPDQRVVDQPGRSDPSDPSAAPAEEPAHYLIAFKDHTIYLAVAYWVDGDTLHYFTAGNTHNQVSISLLDRALTERLNKESGIDFKLSPAK